MTPPNDPPVITDVRQIPGHENAPDFMLHAIQSILDARGDIRAMHEQGAQLYRELISPDGVVSQLRKEIGGIGDAIRDFGQRLTSMETSMSGSQTQLRTELAEVRSEVATLTDRVASVERRVDNIEQRLPAPNGGVPHS